MDKVGVIGLGDMGSGLAKNLLENGFETIGFDLSHERMSSFKSMGGNIAASVKGVAQNANTVFLMVMTGGQAESVIFDDGLADHLAAGSSIILTATIKPSEAIRIADQLKNFELHLIDSPVSGGFPGAQSGTLTMMASGTNTALEKNKKVMEAVSKTIHYVGTNPGDGQTVKACLQSLIGSIFSATFEASTLAAKAGISGDVLFKVFSRNNPGKVRTMKPNSYKERRGRDAPCCIAQGFHRVVSDHTICILRVVLDTAADPTICFTERVFRILSPFAMKVRSSPRSTRNVVGLVLVQNRVKYLAHSGSHVALFAKKLGQCQPFRSARGQAKLSL